ncbi:MAG: glycerate kinase [Parabacteroides sp.]|nr:glycerate kinase [Parabacteroides sp.]
MKKIVLAIDSFKGCLTSAEAEQAAEAGIKAVFPACEVVRIPVADGGEGMLDAWLPVVHGTVVAVEAHDASMQPVRARYGISGDGKTAVIEMAAVNGLAGIPPAKRDPWETITYGTGELIRHALASGCRNLLLGIGGSATNDAGLGMLQALGFRFLDKHGNALGTGGRIMEQVVAVDSANADPLLKEARFTVACDVRNPFCGPEGAACVFAAQKGASEDRIKRLDAGMHSLVAVIRQATGKDITDCPGAGAAGGLGGALLAFLGAELKPGIGLLLDAVGFSGKIAGADWVITGEGRADRQTLMGKVAAGVVAAAKKQRVPVLLIAGSIADVAELNRLGAKGVFSVMPGPASLAQAMSPAFAAANITRLMQQLCSVWG